MTSSRAAITLPAMDTRKHETPAAAPTEWGSDPFSWLRKRNQRRARVALLMQDSKPRRGRTTPVQREHDRHGR
jgi:hypothetical protein